MSLAVLVTVSVSVLVSVSVSVSVLVSAYQWSSHMWFPSRILNR